jgi:outer membrane protein assembly factor BamD
LADDAQMKIGDCYAKQEDYGTAVLAYEKLVREFPDSEWSAIAHYRIGEYNLARAKNTANQAGPLEAARAGFDKYVQKFPEGKYVRDASEKLTEVAGLQAAKEMEIAEFYLRIKKPKSAVRYFELIKKDFAGTETAENANEAIKYLKGIGALRR